MRPATVLPLVVALAVSRTAAAQVPMKLVDLMQVPGLSDPQLSPDGRQLLYVLSTADWQANMRVGHIWRIGTDGGDAVQLTNGPKGESSPRWSPDGQRVAFTATRDTNIAQVYLIANGGGEARSVTHHATGVSDIAWSPAGDAIYFVAEEPKTKEARDRERLKDDVFSYDENYRQRHLWRVTVADGVEHRLTSGDFSVLDYSLSRDGAKVVSQRAPDPLLGDAERSEVWVTDSGGGNAVQLTHNGIAESGAELSPDGTRVLFVAGANARLETYFNQRLFLVPARAGGGPPTPLLADPAPAVEDAHWSRDGRSIVFLANLGVHSELFTVDVATARVRQLTDGAHAIGGWRYDAASGRHAFTLADATSPGEVWTLGPDSGTAAPRRVTHAFDYLTRDYRLPREERITWKGADGVTVEGLLFYPLDYQQGRRYPLVVQTHGGPASSDQYGFYGGTTGYGPVLAAMGYAVLRPNYRGSTGYGDAFLRDMVGHYYKNAHLDVLAGVDQVIRMGVADSGRLVAMGWSAGGHMTDKLITFTTRFKAASAGAGAVNWISMYAESDIRTYRTPWFGGTPWQKNAPIAVYWDNSPLKDIANVKTPTLVFVGQEDPRVPLPQSVELYRALTANGVPTHLYVAPREPHGWGELRHQLFKMNAELEWFERWVMGRSYVWEKAPGAEPPHGPTAEAGAGGPDR